MSKIMYCNVNVIGILLKRRRSFSSQKQNKQKKKYAIWPILIQKFGGRKSCLNPINLFYLGKLQKKSSSNGQAIKRGGGGKGRAIKEKRTIFFTVFTFKNKIILFQTTYRNMDISRLLVGIFTLLQYFPRNRAILVQKLWGDKKLPKSFPRYFKTKKKVPMAIMLKGWGVNALMA